VLVLLAVLGVCPALHGQTKPLKFVCVLPKDGDCNKAQDSMQCADSVFVLLALCHLCVLQAYDQHLNMILGDVEETITTVEVDDETYEEIIKVS
jgi:hypothetical protein